MRQVSKPKTRFSFFFDISRFLNAVPFIVEETTATSIVPVAAQRYPLPKINRKT